MKIKSILSMAPIALCMWIAFAPTGAWAQLQSDARAMYDRMDRLERDITLLQRKVYKSDSADYTAKPSDARADADYNAETSPAPAEGNLSHLYVKIADLEKLVATLTAELEELKYAQQQLQERQNKMNADIDFRFSELTAQQEKALAKPKDELVQKPADKKSDLKKQTASSKAVQETSNDNANAASKSATAASQSATEAYDEAYNLLKEAKYQEAEQALQAFLIQYPNDKLAGNAQYWLGETYYVRANYEQAAIAFAKGYKNYKTSSKAPDNLLKLGLAMEQLDKKKEACTAFKNLSVTFENAPQTILNRAEKEMAKLGCSK